MPPLIAFAGALGGLAVVRWAYRTALRVNRELEEARLGTGRRSRAVARHSDAAAGPQHRRLSAGLMPLRFWQRLRAVAASGRSP